MSGREDVIERRACGRRHEHRANGETRLREQTTDDEAAFGDEEAGESQRRRIGEEPVIGNASIVEGIDAGFNQRGLCP